MKKLFALLLVVASLFIMASCSMPPKLDMEKAADNLEDHDYMVSYSDDEEDLEAGMVEMLTAYGDDDEYLVMAKFETFKLARLYYKQFKIEQKAEIDELEAEIKALKLEIKIAKYELKKYDDDSGWDDDDIDEMEDKLDDLKEELKEARKEVKFGILGKIVWYGSKDAFKDSKK